MAIRRNRTYRCEFCLKTIVVSDTNSRWHYSFCEESGKTVKCLRVPSIEVSKALQKKTMDRRRHSPGRCSSCGMINRSSIDFKTCDACRRRKTKKLITKL